MNLRRGKIDAVTITGGEPTIQNDLESFIRQVKNMGFAVKLDTNGSHPQVIKALLAEKLLDFIAMDIKAPLENTRILSTRRWIQSKLKKASVLF